MDLWERGYAKSLITIFKKPGSYVGLKRVSPRNEADSVLTRVYFDIANECVFEFNVLDRRVFGTYQSEDGVHITANWHFTEAMKSNPFKGSVTRTQNGTVLKGTIASDSIVAIIRKQP